MRPIEENGKYKIIIEDGGVLTTTLAVKNGTGLYVNIRLALCE